MIVLNTISTATNINSRPSQEIIMTATGTSDVIALAGVIDISEEDAYTALERLGLKLDEQAL